VRAELSDGEAKVWNRTSQVPPACSYNLMPVPARHAVRAARKYRTRGWCWCRRWAVAVDAPARTSG